MAVAEAPPQQCATNAPSRSALKGLAVQRRRQRTYERQTSQRLRQIAQPEHLHAVHNAAMASRAEALFACPNAVTSQPPRCR